MNYFKSIASVKSSISLRHQRPVQTESPRSPHRTLPHVKLVPTDGVDCRTTSRGCGGIRCGCGIVLLRGSAVAGRLDLLIGSDGGIVGMLLQVSRACTTCILQALEPSEMSSDVDCIWNPSGMTCR